jgi:hypothetical protein
LAGLTAFLVYLRTLAPSIVWGDSPELTTAAFCAGVPHPTGYPLYMLLAHAFLRCCPFGSPAYRMNLLTALSAGMAVALVYPLSLSVTRSRRASVVVALLFAFSQTFWSQAVIGEVYAFQMFCTAAVVVCVLQWNRRGDRRWLFASALVYGLCCTHHGMSALLLPGLLFFALSSRHRAQFVRELPRTLPLFLLPLGLYVYLPVAALRNPPANWGDPLSWPNFLDHVTGQQYHYLMFHMTAARLWGQLQAYAGTGVKRGLLTEQYPPGLLWLAPLGAWSLGRRRPRLLGLLLLIYLADLLYAFNYDVSDVEVYYLPSHLVVALWIGCGIRHSVLCLCQVWRRIRLPAVRRHVADRAMAAVLLLFPLLLLRANWKLNDEHSDYSALLYAHALLTTLKPHTLLLGDGDYGYFPLLYARFVEHQRPDVAMLQIRDALSPGCLRLVTRLSREGVRIRVPARFPHYPPHSLHCSLFKQVIADNIVGRPLYVLWTQELLREPALTAAVAPYYQVSTSNLPGAQLLLRPPQLGVAHPHPQHVQRLCFGTASKEGAGASLEFLGYDLGSVATDDLPLLRITYYWRINNPQTPGQARVWVIFTDQAGGYRQGENGYPEFHNIHPLAYGLGSKHEHVPESIEETYTLSVPPADWNRPLHVRVAVESGGRFLPWSGHTSNWAEIGQLNYEPTTLRLPQLAAARPLDPRE